ncbi:hypothetical protein [Pectobacterium brasiliense]|uniref:hypothetical protein n=1 Tax=Pectobacterium brasiliense TaxID=180957 RepID=UPI003D9B4C6A
MGMFDEVRAINISHKNFDRKHNGYTFQTKDLECDMSEYCVFNGVLYQEVDNSGEHKRHDHALKLDYSGELNIYTHTRESGIESWVEYDLVFKDGELVDVVPYEVRVTEDNRDLSAHRPNKPSNQVEVTISVSNCDRDKQDAFVDFINDEKLEAIRDILGEPTATVFYPTKRASDTRFGFPVYPRLLTIASVVQTKEDLEAAMDGIAKVTAPNGDKISIFLDEAHRLT